MVIAPHTSSWDFIWGRFIFSALGLKVRFLIKKEMFFWPFGYWLKAMGGIPVDRKRSSNAVIEIAEFIEKQERIIFIVTPEGTRKLNKNWKKGFYYIALRAKVPLVLGYIDYAKKEGGIGPIFYPSGDYTKDFTIMEDFYKHKTAKFPKNYNLSRIYWDKEEIQSE